MTAGRTTARGLGRAERAHHGLNANLLRRWIVQYSDTKASSAADALPKVAAAALLPVTTPMPSAPRPPLNSDSYVDPLIALDP